jgi:hypothetical protein
MFFRDAKTVCLNMQKQYAAAYYGAATVSRMTLKRLRLWCRNSQLNDTQKA